MFANGERQKVFTIMDMQEKLRPFVNAIKEDSENPWAWLQLGDAAKLMTNLEIAGWAYAAALLLLPEDETILRKFSEIREKTIQESQKKIDVFHFPIFKLPQKTCLFLCTGVMNMEEMDTFDTHIKSLLKGGFRRFIFDMTGIPAISGLGPSILRECSKAIENMNGTMWLIGVCPAVQNVLRLNLKNIKIPQFQDIGDLLTSWKKKS